MVTWTDSNVLGVRILTGGWRRWMVLINPVGGTGGKPYLRISQGSRVIMSGTMSDTVTVADIQRMAVGVIHALNVVEEFRHE